MSNNLPTRFKATWSVEDSTFCCGVWEAGRLRIEIVSARYIPYWGEKERPNPAYQKACETKQGVWNTAELQNMRSSAGARPLMFNLVVDNADTSELRELLKQQDDCTLVHTWKNPGTGSLLEMYVLTNGSSETNTDYEDNNCDDY